MKSKPTKVTIHDVAERAGVSQPTVSKVLNNYAYVKPSTKAKVLQAVEELGFKPDAIARSLVKNKTSTIGLIVGDISNPFYAETAKVIIRNAHKKGYEVILLDTDYRSDHFEQCLQTLLAKRVDGMIVASVTRTDKRVKELHEAGIPVLLYNRNLDDKAVSYIELDNKKGAMLAVRHLTELGHRRIAYISGPTRYSSFSQRLQGYAEGLAEQGLAHDRSLTYGGPFEYEDILQFSRGKMRLNPAERPTAFLVATDQMAFAVMDAAAKEGLHVPGDVSVVGFDNIDISGNPLIALTTVSQQKKRMASLAVQYLISGIEEQQLASSPIQITLEPELIIRRTSGPARN